MEVLLYHLSHLMILIEQLIHMDLLYLIHRFAYLHNQQDLDGSQDMVFLLLPLILLHLIIMLKHKEVLHWQYLFVYLHNQPILNGNQDMVFRPLPFILQVEHLVNYL